MDQGLELGPQKGWELGSQQGPALQLDKEVDRDLHLVAEKEVDDSCPAHP